MVETVTDDLGWTVTTSTTPTVAPVPAATPTIAPVPVAAPTVARAAPVPEGAVVEVTAAAQPSTAPLPSGAAADVVVAAGDSLWSIAARHLPADATDAEVAAAWPRWYDANSGVIGADPGLILPGQVLTVPAPTTEPTL